MRFAPLALLMALACSKTIVLPGRDGGPTTLDGGAAARDAGACTAGYVLLRLPLEIKNLFREWLHDNLPDRARHVMTLLRGMRGGKDYDAQWGTRMKGTGPYAQMMARRFHMATRRLGLNQPRPPLVLNRFRRPPQSGDQLALF